MSLEIPPQSVFLYNGKWTQEVDNLLLTTMIRLRDASNWSGFVIPTHFLMEASDVVYEKFKIRFTRHELYDRLQSLENRFRSFNNVIDVSGVIWNANPNTITASDDIWRSIFKVWYTSKMFLMYRNYSYNILQ